MINDGLIYALGSLVTTQAQRLFALSISPDHAFPFLLHADLFSAMT